MGLVSPLELSVLKFLGYFCIKNAYIILTKMQQFHSAFIILFRRGDSGGVDVESDIPMSFGLLSVYGNSYLKF